MSERARDVPVGGDERHAVDVSAREETRAIPRIFPSGMRIPLTDHEIARHAAGDQVVGQDVGFDGDAWATTHGPSPPAARDHAGK